MAQQTERPGTDAQPAAARPSVTIELAGLASPIAGRVLVEGGRSRAFTGYAQLIAALESWRGSEAGDGAG